MADAAGHDDGTAALARAVPRRRAAGNAAPAAGRARRPLLIGCSALFVAGVVP